MVDLIFYDGMPKRGEPYFFSIRINEEEIIHMCKDCVIKNINDFDPQLENGESVCDVCQKNTW
jgi:hypothetical protein